MSSLFLLCLSLLLGCDGASVRILAGHSECTSASKRMLAVQGERMSATVHMMAGRSERMKMRKAKAAMAKATRKAAREAEAAHPTPPPPLLEEIDPGAVPGTSEVAAS